MLKQPPFMFTNKFCEKQHNKGLIQWKGHTEAKSGPKVYTMHFFVKC